MINQANTNSVLLNKIDLALRGSRFNSWEHKFLSDVRRQISNRKKNNPLSPKQYSKLNELIGRSGVSEEPRNLAAFKKARNHRAINRHADWFRSIRRFNKASYVKLMLLAGLIVWATASVSLDKVFDGEQQSVVYANLPFTVTDGDTIRFKSHSKGTRLVGFNTPETNQYICDGQQALGGRATARLKNIVKTSKTAVQMVACACRPGTHGTSRCNFGRSCAILYSNGVNGGDILISEGLAAPFRCGKSSCPKVPRPWCG